MTSFSKFAVQISNKEISLFKSITELIISNPGLTKSFLNKNFEIFETLLINLIRNYFNSILNQVYRQQIPDVLKNSNLTSRQFLFIKNLNLFKNYKNSFISFIKKQYNDGFSDEIFKLFQNYFNLKSNLTINEFELINEFNHSTNLIDTSNQLQIMNFFSINPPILYHNSLKLKMIKKLI